MCFVHPEIGYYATKLASEILSQNVGEVLPEWQEGDMEIHHIFAGGGESVFCQREKNILYLF